MFTPTQCARTDMNFNRRRLGGAVVQLVLVKGSPYQPAVFAIGCVCFPQLYMFVSQEKSCLFFSFLSQTFYKQTHLTVVHGFIPIINKQGELLFTEFKANIVFSTRFSYIFLRSAILF